MRKVLIIIGAAIVIPVLFVVILIGRSITLQLMGYPVDVPPSELADEIAAENGNPLRCRRLQQTVPTMGPSLTEKRMLCVYIYAKLTQDPTACELLLPSEYGLACLSDVGGKIMHGIRCNIFTGETSLYCRGKKNAELVMEDPTIEECASYEREDVREWCFFMRTLQISQVHECNQMQSEEAEDECETGYAFKQKDPSLCSAVKDDKRKKYCEIRINTWLAYPSLRNSFYFGRAV